MKIQQTELPKKALQLKATARELFMRHGIRRVTIEEICKTSGISKMTFYKYFSNKTDIAQRVVMDIYEEGQQWFDEISAQPMSFVEKVEKMLQLKMEMLEKMSDEFLTELMDLETELKEFVLEQQHKHIQHTLDFFMEAQKQGEIRQEIAPQFILFMLNHSLQIVRDPQLTQIIPNPRERVKELSYWLVYGLMPSPEHH